MLYGPAVQDYRDHDAVALAALARTGEATPQELLAAARARAAEVNPGLNAIVREVDPPSPRGPEPEGGRPFAGVPFLLKDLHQHLAGVPTSGGSRALVDVPATETSAIVERWVEAGLVVFGKTNSPEFGAKGVTEPHAFGATRNPWNIAHTPGGSSGGSAAAVAAGIVPCAAASDGGGSIRIPAAFCGLLGLKCTWGRIPRGPRVGPGNLTAVPGCVSRSVRDTARWFDVSNGFDPRDPFSLPRVEGWERDLGKALPDLAGKRAAIVVDIGQAVVAPEVVELVTEAAEALIALAGLRRVDVAIRLPRTGAAWGVTGSVGVLKDLGDRWPDRADDLTPAMRRAAEAASEHYDARAAIQAERRRIELNEAMADLFEQADVVLASTNPDVAFGADTRAPTTFGGLEAKPINHGALTIPSNIYGNPAISIPVGQAADGLPVGLQVLAPHFQEQVLLDLSLAVERERPWPLVAPGAPV